MLLARDAGDVFVFVSCFFFFQPIVVFVIGQVESVVGS